MWIAKAGRAHISFHRFMQEKPRQAEYAPLHFLDHALYLKAGRAHLPTLSSVNVNHQDRELITLVSQVLVKQAKAGRAHLSTPTSVNIKSQGRESTSLVTSKSKWAHFSSLSGLCMNSKGRTSTPVHSLIYNNEYPKLSLWCLQEKLRKEEHTRHSNENTQCRESTSLVSQLHSWNAKAGRTHHLSLLWLASKAKAGRAHLLSLWVVSLIKRTKAGRALSFSLSCSNTNKWSSESTPSVFLVYINEKQRQVEHTSLLSHALTWILEIFS